MEIVNKRLTLHEFQVYVKGYDFGPILPGKLVLHHTWHPTKESWAGERTIGGLKRYYEGKKWKAGPHIFVAEDGIWLFSPMRKDGIHAGKLNKHSIGIEIVGNYDTEKWSGQTKQNAIGTIKILMDRLGIKEGGVFFHRDASPKSCPGWAINREWVFNELKNFSIKPRIPSPSELMERVETLSVPTPTFPSAPGEEEVMIPVWAAEAVAFVCKHKLFEVRTLDDVRDAVKFYRFYQLIDSEFYED